MIKKVVVEVERGEVIFGVLNIRLWWMEVKRKESFIIYSKGWCVWISSCLVGVKLRVNDNVFVCSLIVRELLYYLRYYYWEVFFKLKLIFY